MNTSSTTKKKNDIFILALVISYLKKLYYCSYRQVFYINNNVEVYYLLKIKSQEATLLPSITDPLILELKWEFRMGNILRITESNEP